MNEIIFLVQEEPEGGYTARALSHSIFTEANTWEELEEAAWEAVYVHFEEEKQQIDKLILVYSENNNSQRMEYEIKK